MTLLRRVLTRRNERIDLSATLALWLYLRICALQKKLGQRRLFRRLASGLRRHYESASASVRTVIHGREVLVNPGNVYPMLLQQVPTFNAPLVQLISQLFRTRQNAIRVLDIGAGLGDTVLLLEQKCPHQVGAYICIEGDREFFRLLEINTADLSKVSRLFLMLASCRKMIPS